MIFKFPIDSDIELLFPQDSFSEELFTVIDSNRDYLSHWLSWPKSTKTIDDTRIFIKNSIISFAQGQSTTYIIQYKTKIIGVIGFIEIHKKIKRVEIGYWISCDYQGNGIVTIICKKLIQYAFDCLDIEKIQIATATDNTASRMVCQRLGLTLEGVIKNSENIHGKIIDHAIYGLYKNTIS